MAAKYWMKLYYEILDDPKMGRLPDNVYRRCVELFLLAGRLDENGQLPETADIAWMLRQHPEALEAELQHLESVGILTKTDEGWVVTNFSKRQEAVSDAERMRQYRKRKQKEQFEDQEELPDAPSNEEETPVLREENEGVTSSVTKSNRDKITDTDKDSNNSNELLASADEILENPKIFTIKQIELCKFTISQYELLKDREKADGKPRKGVLKFIRAKLKPKSPAVEVYRSEANTYPEYSLWEDISREVGEKQEDLDFWRKVVHGYIGLGWNKFNVTNMLAYYRERKMPVMTNGATSPRASPNGKNGNHQSAGGATSPEQQRQIELYGNM